MIFYVKYVKKGYNYYKKERQKMKKNIQINLSQKKIESINNYIDSNIYINNFTHLIEICIHDYFLKNDKKIMIPYT